MTLPFIAQALLASSLSLLFAQEADLEAILRKGLEKYAQRDFAKAVNIWRAGLKAARDQRDPLFEGSFLGNLGIVHIALRELDEAERNLTEAIRLAHENNDRAGEKNRLNTLGGLQLMRNQFDDALGTLDRGLKIAIALEDKLLECDIHSNLALGHIGLRQYGKARQQLESAIESGDEPRKKRDRERLQVLDKLTKTTSQ